MLPTDDSRQQRAGGRSSKLADGWTLRELRAEMRACTLCSGSPDLKTATQTSGPLPFLPPNPDLANENAPAAEATRRRLKRAQPSSYSTTSPLAGV